VASPCGGGQGLPRRQGHRARSHLDRRQGTVCPDRRQCDRRGPGREPSHRVQDHRERRRGGPAGVVPVRETFTVTFTIRDLEVVSATTARRPSMTRRALITLGFVTAVGASSSAQAGGSAYEVVDEA